MEAGAPDPDASLMLAFARGDEAAFDVLFERWAARLLRYLERMVRDTATAEELLQETFLRVHGARERYQPRARFSTWLYRIATNLALNELRRPQRARPHVSADGEDAGSGGSPPLCSEDASPEALTEARLAHERIDRALGAIPERQRMALWLCAVEGLSYAEVGRVLATSPKSVKSLVHRARCSLADALAAAASGGRGGHEAAPPVAAARPSGPSALAGVAGAAPAAAPREHDRRRRR